MTFPAKRPRAGLSSSLYFHGLQAGGPGWPRRKTRRLQHCEKDLVNCASEGEGR